jgi:potassium efflux system protein
MTFCRMNSSILRITPLACMVILFFLPLIAASAAAEESTPSAAISDVSITTLESKIEAVEADTILSAENKSELVSLYRKAISNLEKAVASEKAAEAFIQMNQDAPLKAAELRSKTSEKRKLHPEKSIEVTPTTLIETLDKLLLKEKADLAAVEAKLQKTRESIKYQTGRPQAIREQLIDSKKQLSGIADALSAPLAEGQRQPLEEATYWLRESEARMLSAQIKMLDQELVSQPARLDLLTAEEEKAEHSVQFVKTRVRLLEELVEKRRQQQAQLTESKAESARAYAKGKHSLIEQLAAKNAELSTQISELTERLKKVEDEKNRISAEEKRISDDSNITMQKLKVAGLSQILGQILQEQRRLLPDTRSYKRNASKLVDQIAQISLRQIQFKDELGDLNQLDNYIADYTAEITAAEREQIDNELRYLLKDRQQFLLQAYKTGSAYLRSLSELDVAQRSLSEVVEQYDAFLAEHLLWVRSTEPASLSTISLIPAQMQELLVPEHWRDFIVTLFKQTTSKPWMAFTLFIVGILLWKARLMRRSLIASGDNVGNVMRDSILTTAWGLFLTLLLASTWPLLMASVGWQLLTALESSTFTKNIGNSLILISKALFILRAYRVLCMRGGVADRHFKWPATGLGMLRRDIDILIYTFLPAAFIAIIVISSDIPGHQQGLGRLAFVVAALALTAFFYRVLNPSTGAMREFAIRDKIPAKIGIRYLWLIIAVVIPLGTVILAMLGYLYSAGTLLGNLIESLWLVLGLVVLQQFVSRWLLIARRRLALKEARAERKAALATRDSASSASGDDALEPDQDRIDINALSADTRKLINTVLAVLAVLMLWAVWSDTLPAFRIFDEIELWQHKVDVEGEVKYMPITLADISLAIITLTILIILVKRLPAFIELLLRQRSSITPGSLYAIKSLTSYTLVAVGIAIVFSTLGGTWSQIKWIFAALGVGIGFGLQEIVANFISGLIILFERPIRIGDVVTVGDVSGVVTKIRIRATTIRDFDRKELLVPNKEFITTRLLNWSLSDTLSRQSVTVGIAYGSDVELATRLMEEAAMENEYTLDEPAAFVTFESFGDNALTLVLRYFIDNMDYRLVSNSSLHEAINQKFNAAGITIAFPQRDVHLDTTRPLEIRIQREEK